MKTSLPAEVRPLVFQKKTIFFIVLGIVLASGFYFYHAYGSVPLPGDHGLKSGLIKTDTIGKRDSSAVKTSLVLDTLRYDQLLKSLSNGDSSGRWPVKLHYPLPGAIFPFNRVIAYYGNLYSKKMGVLGEYPTDEMFQRLQKELKSWQAADSTVPVMPALHYIAVTAQGSPGKGNTYRLRMPYKQIDSIIRMAARINALVFLDIQVGMSNVKEEVPMLEQYLKLPQVHLGIDPEFSMKTAIRLRHCPCHC